MLWNNSILTVTQMVRYCQCTRWDTVNVQDDPYKCKCIRWDTVQDEIPYKMRHCKRTRASDIQYWTTLTTKQSYAIHVLSTGLVPFPGLCSFQTLRLKYSKKLCTQAFTRQSHIQAINRTHKNMHTLLAHFELIAFQSDRKMIFQVTVRYRYICTPKDTHVHARRC